MWAHALYIYTDIAYCRIVKFDRRESWYCLRIGTKDGAVNGDDIYTESVLQCPSCRKNVLAPPDVSTIYCIFSLYTVYYFSIDLSAFTKIFMIIAKIFIKIVIT
jgi:hypothetical protein